MRWLLSKEEELADAVEVGKYTVGFFMGRPDGLGKKSEDLRRLVIRKAEDGVVLDAIGPWYSYGPYAYEDQNLVAHSLKVYDLFCKWDLATWPDGNTTVLAEIEQAESIDVATDTIAAMKAIFNLIEVTGVMAEKADRAASAPDAPSDAPLSSLGGTWFWNDDDCFERLPFTVLVNRVSLESVFPRDQNAVSVWSVNLTVGELAVLGLVERLAEGSHTETLLQLFHKGLDRVRSCHGPLVGDVPPEEQGK